MKNATPLPLLDEIEDLKKNCPLQGIIENYSKITINLCCEKKPWNSSKINQLIIKTLLRDNAYKCACMCIAAKLDKIYSVTGCTSSA